MHNLYIGCKFINIFLYVSVLRNVDARGVPGIPWLINTQKLFEWADEVRIDPNNPEYSDLIEFIMVSCSKYPFWKYILFPKLGPLYSSIECCTFF